MKKTIQTLHESHRGTGCPRLAAVCLALLCATAICGRAADITWTNTAGGNWNTAANWSPNTVPGSGDSALLTNSGTYTVTLDVDATVASLTLGGASGTQTFSASSRNLTLNSASAINGNGVMALANSTLAGTGTLTNQGTLNVANSVINAGLVNQGLLVFLVNCSVNGLFENQAGATVRLQAPDSHSSLTVASGFTRADSRIR